MPARKVKFIPTINGTVSFEDDMIYLKGFDLYSSIYSGLPLGYFDLIDANGTLFIAKMDNIQVGASVSLKLVADDESFGDVKLDDYVILKIETKGNSSTDKAAGLLRVWFGQKAFLMKDMQNKAYEAMEPAELIKRVLADDSRGFSFGKPKKIDKLKGAKLCRFKTLESDWEFLQNKVIPYVSSDNAPVHLFVNAKNEVYVASFNTLYSTEAKVLFAPKMIDDDSLEDFNEFKSANSSVKVVDAMSGLAMQISSHEAQESLRKVFYLEDAEMKSVVSGLIAPSVKIDSAGDLSKTLPIDYAYGKLGSGTSVSYVRNHDLEDEVATLHASQSYLDKFISLKFTAPMNSSTYLIGETILIYMAKNHWINGKWVVTSIDIHAQEDDKDILEVDYEVCRPSYNGSRSKTTLAAPEMLYKIG